MSALPAQTPEKVFQDLCKVWIDTCRKAVQSEAAGRPYDAAQQFRDSCAEYSVARDIVEDAIRSVPYRSLDRSKLLADSYGRLYPDLGRFYRENATWALQSEMEAIDGKLRPVFEGRMKTQLQAEAQTKIQQQATVIQFPQPQQGAIAPPEQIEKIFSSGSSDTVPDRVADLAEKVADGYRRLGVNVSAILEECDSKAPRCDRITLRGAIEITPSSLLAKKDQVLSNADIDPEAGVMVRHLRGNRFELLIPKPKDLWTFPRLFEYVSDAQGLAIFGSKSRDPVKDYFAYLRKYWEVSMDSPLSVPFMQDVSGSTFCVSLCSSSSAHVLFGGKSGGGKSEGLRNLIFTAALLYPPEWLRLSLFDFKEGTALGCLNGLGHLNHEVMTKPSQLDELFPEIDNEYKRRQRAIAEAGCRNLLEFNAMKMSRGEIDEILPFHVVGIDEVSLYKEEYGSTADENMAHALKLWRSAGVSLVVATQYPTQKQSMPKEVRQNFGTGICVKADPACGEYTFYESTQTAHSVTHLIPPGDCLVKDNIGFTRGQIFDLPKDHYDKVFKHMLRIYPRTGHRRQVGQAKSQDVLAFLDGGDEPPPGKPELRLVASPKEDLAARVQSAIKRLGDRLTITSLTREVFGVSGGAKFGDRKEEVNAVLRDLFGTDDIETIAKQGHAQT